jgi:hypothetical protein
MSQELMTAIHQAKQIKLLRSRIEVLEQSVKRLEALISVDSKPTPEPKSESKLEPQPAKRQLKKKDDIE